MDVADVAATGGVGAGSFDEFPFKARFINIADWLADEMAAADGAIAIDGNDGMASATGMTEAQVIGVVDGEKRIDGGELLDDLRLIIIGFIFVSVDPEIDIGRQFAAQGMDFRLVFLHSDNADAVANAALGKLAALGKETGARYFGRMISRPERNSAGITLIKEIQAAGEVGLDGDFQNV